MSSFVATMLSVLFSWRTLALILAILNLKSIPSAWHLRIYYLSVRKHRLIPHNRQYIASSPSTITTTGAKAVHPLFRPVTIESRASLYEIDFNLHKSNSTYFADLDHSRTALISSILTPAVAKNALVSPANPNVRPGLLYPILGSVHTSFLREIKPLQSYSIRSRLLAWDRKWLIIATYFVRAASGAEKARMKKEGKEVIEEVLLACALSKYVLKQGRRTIEPGLALSASGWYEYRPLPAVNNESDKTTGTDTPNLVPGPSNTTIDTAETMRKIVRRLSMGTDTTDGPRSNGSSTKSPWSHDDIERERLRGLKIVERWLGLDVDLRGEYDHSIEEELL